jgi:hydrogenase nickel incorporation protein HypA/HybF
MEDLSRFLRESAFECGRITQSRQTMVESVSGRPHSPYSTRALPMEHSMHELSIAMSIVDMALEEAERRDVMIDAVYLELGPLSGVVAEALLFSYEVACNGTRLEGSRLVIKDVPIEVYCPACKTQRILASMQWFCLSWSTAHPHQRSFMEKNS